MGIMWDLGLGILLNIIFRSWDMNEIADFLGGISWDFGIS